MENTTSTPAKKLPFYRSLYVQVITAVIIGVLLGHFYPTLGEAMKPLGDGFIKLIKMIIAPIIFCTVVVGIAGMEDMKKVGKTGGLALLYFEVVSSIALVVGLVLVNVLQARRGHEHRPGHARHQGHRLVHRPRQDDRHGRLHPEHHSQHAGRRLRQGRDPAGAADRGAVRLCAAPFGGRGTLVFDVIEKGSHVLFGIVNYIMKLAPIGAFGAMAFTIGKYGLGSLFSLGKLMGTFYLTCLLFIFVVLGLIARFHGFSIWKFIKYIKEELLIVLGTSSSESVLPRMMEKMENLGANKTWWAW
jgi:aerobic C4-dicarboxylate transport protein